VPPPALLTPDEVDALGDRSSALYLALQWSREFVAQRNDNLGRPGTVCPFVATSTRNQIAWFVEVPGDIEQRSDVEAVLHELRETFLRLEPSSGQEALFKTIIIVFPDMAPENAQDFIDKVQFDLKPSFVEEGLMLGQFHPASEQPGIHNPEFRPLRSPIPMLVIRYMVQKDLLFLQGDDYSPIKRIQFVAAYLLTCKRLDIGHERFRDHVEEAAYIIRDLARELDEL
jgi:hypothetical protein